MVRVASVPKLQSMTVTLPLAAALWVIVFLWQPVNFWVLMSLATGSLGLLALSLRGAFPLEEGFRPGDVVIGVVSAALLYGVFWAGDVVSSTTLPFAPRQVGEVYQLRSLAHPALLALLLATVIAPGEELYWRGLVQQRFDERWGPWKGWALGTAAYGGVHMLTANPMLVVAATVAGAVWGALYAHQRRILPVLISHVVWGLLVFVLFPLHN
ncbi:MAG: lysostaphin resistance A-like protein [Dehalococcoidia bacterium]